MRVLAFIAKNNIKKKKSDAVVLFLLIGLSALLLYISISALTNTDKVLTTAYDNFHAADFFYLTGSSERERMTEIFREQEETAEIEISECLFLSDAKYHSGKEEEKEYPFLLESIEEKKIGVLPAFYRDELHYNSILLPYYLKANGNYEKGDTIWLTLQGRKYEFKVLGFVEDPLMALPSNVMLYRCYISKECLSDMLSENKDLKNSLCSAYKVRLKEGERGNEFEEKITPVLTKELPEQAGSYVMAFNWDTMKSAGTMLFNISMGIILTFSLLLILIILIIVRFSIKNFIEENLKNIGILQAAGYTAGQLMQASLLEMGGIALCGIAGGIFAGFLCSKAIGDLQAAILGLSWNQGFDGRTAVFVSGVILAVILAVTYTISRIYHKITVLDALRGGIHTHNFRKNFLPLDKCPLPEQAALGCKSILGEKLKNTAILFIVIFLAFTNCVGFSLYQNFALDSSNMIKMIGQETATAMISGSDIEEKGKEISKWPEVEQVLYSDSANVKITSKDKGVSITCDIWDDPKLLVNETVLEGRLPEYDNEILLTAAICEELGVETGDIVYVEGTGEKKDYMVSGKDQKINNMGRKATMTLEGAGRLNGDSQVTSVYIKAVKGYEFEKLRQKLEKHFNGITIVDGEKMIEESMMTLTMSMKLICQIFAVVTALVVAMVVILLIKTKIMRERKNYGIYKALGFTTGQLIRQILISNLTVITMGALAGVVLGKFATSPLVAATLSFCGIKKCTMVTSPFWLFISAAEIVAVAMCISLLYSAKIRKIEPVKLLTEE